MWTKSKRTFLLQVLLCSILLGSISLWADPAPFDLTGPALEIKVTRAGKTLPIAQVPNLKPGDRIWIHPVVANGDSEHFLLIAAFLKGPTSPPPEKWFTKAETWSKDIRDEGITVTVPADAQHALLFLAPRTGGDFNTLRSTVQGKPGAFIRAAQDLNQASLDRSRLDRYIQAVSDISRDHPKALHDSSVLLARSLSIKLDEKCFDKPTAQQAPCLMQNTDQLVLSDNNGGDSMLTTLTSGAEADLIGQIGYTKMAGGGAYSPYFGAVVDMVRIMQGIHTAQYQYIPALSLPKNEQLTLRLNNPPSFRKPQSVIVVALPPVADAKSPEIRPFAPDQVYCLQKTSETLAVVGAPLVFSTELAHDLVLRLQPDKDKPIDVPVTADPVRGGLVLGKLALHPNPAAAELTGTLRGHWGFQSFVGPSFHLRSGHSLHWKLTGDNDDQDGVGVIVGQDDTVHLSGESAVCVDQIAVKDNAGKSLKSSWKLTKPDELALTLPLKEAKPGLLSISIQQFGVAKPDELKLTGYAEAGHLDKFAIHAGDREGVLEGTHLDEVAGLEWRGAHFTPAALSRTGGDKDKDDKNKNKNKEQLRLSSSTAPETASDAKLTAQVSLKDGRILEVQATLEPPRPQLTLMSKSIVPGNKAASVHISNPEDLPLDAQLSFFVKAEVPATFSPSESIEVSDAAESFHTVLTVAKGGLILQDAQTALALLNPLKSFGPSAFGPLRFRAVDASGATSNWQPLARLVRVPELKEIRCPDSPDKGCALIGSNLFLIESVAADAAFTQPVQVPAGYVQDALSVPRPNGTLLYLKLRDDPATVSPVVLPVLPDQR